MTKSYLVFFLDKIYVYLNKTKKKKMKITKFRTHHFIENARASRAYHATLILNGEVKHLNF